MFKKSRSKRANRNAALQTQQAPPTAAAAIAAYQAANPNPGDGRLAAGAAAAALRSHASSPVNVGEVQTRRMIRRNSITSATSDTSYQQGGQTRMSRSGSVSSMASRTFRSPSPHGRRPFGESAPPVPAIPRSGATSPTSMGSRTFRRPASTEPTPRMMSPTPQSSARNMSVDAATRRRPIGIKTSNLQDAGERQNGNRNSINFSRPMSPELRGIGQSPTSPQFASPKGDVSDSEESYLTAGAMGARARGDSTDHAPIPTTRPRRMPLPRRISEEPDEDDFEEVFDPHTRTMVKRRKPGFKPKPVQSPPRVASPSVSSPPPRQRQPAPVIQQPSPARSPARANVLTTAAAAAAVADLPPPPTSKSRDVSASPARKARFSLRPEEKTVLHEPPRALTPTKSALRKSPSPRGMSPADSNGNRLSWNQPGFNPSEASETTSQISDDRPKRRSVRVSFDDQPTFVGSSITPPTSVDSPITMSPQHDKKKNWFGLRKHKGAQEEGEDGLAPIPTLPSFGSVRGRRPTEEEEEEEKKEQLSKVLGIPGVALTTGEQTPSEAGSHVDEAEPRENPARLNTQLDGSKEAHVNGNVKKMKSGYVPTIEVIPGTPGAETQLNDLLYATNGKEETSPVVGANPATAGIAEPEPEAVAAAHDPNTPVVGHVAEAIQEQTSASDKMETDSQDSHYSDAAEAVDPEGDGFGSINAIIESPVIDADSPKKAMAESLPPLSVGPPTEIEPVPAAEAVKGDEPTTFREAIADSTKKPVDAPRESLPSPPSPTNAKPATNGQKSPVESITYNPRRLGSKSSSRDASPSGPKRFPERVQQRMASSDLRQSPIADNSNERALSQSSAYPTLDRSPRQSFQNDGRRISGSPDPSSPVAASTPQKSVVAADSVKTSTPTSNAGTPGRAGTEKKPLKSALKQTARTPIPPEPPLAAQPRGALQKRNRPLSTTGMPAAAPQSDAVMLAQAMIKVQENRAKEAKAREADVQETLSRARATSVGMTQATSSKRSSFMAPQPKPRRRGSDGSDSSFKRGPPSIMSDGGRMTMRRSMRAEPPSRPQSMVGPPPPRQSVRPEPSGAQRPMSMVGGGWGARSMRQPSRDPSPTRSILSFRKPKRASSVQPRSSGKRMGSRFDDSSDEDDGYAPSITTSRFEERRAKMRPARSIPTRTAEVDSSDLDSDEDPLPATAQSPTSNDRLMELARERLGIESRPEVPQLDEHDNFGQSDLVTAFAEKKQAKDAKKRSFFGSLTRRRKNDKVSKNDEEASPRGETAPERSVLQRRNTGESSALSTPERPKYSRHSTSERPTYNRQSTSERPAYNRQSTSERPTYSRQGTLEKPGYSRQNTAERAAYIRNQVDPDSWPLPESPTMGQRPETSDGSPPQTLLERPQARRQISTETAPVYGRSGKKKRFPLLRRAFGLHD